MLDQNATSTPQPGAAPRPRPSPVAADPSLTDSADQAFRSVAALYNAVDGSLARRVQDNPYATLAAAAGVGFILGGGMRSPIGQLLLRLSVRTFGPPLVNAALHNVIERASQSVGTGYATPTTSQRGERT